MSVAMPQLMLPLLLAVEATKKGLLAFLQQMGMVVLSELLATEAAQIAGPKGKHIEGRTHHHWGTATTPVSFGGSSCVVAPSSRPSPNACRAERRPCPEFIQ